VKFLKSWRTAAEFRPLNGVGNGPQVAAKDEVLGRGFWVFGFGILKEGGGAQRVFPDKAV